MKPALLIVDDEPLFLRTLGRALSSDGYEVLMSDSGHDAIEKFRKSSPAIVLLDLGLPDMNGLTLLNEMKKTGEEAEFIMMTGQGGVKEAVEAMKLGAENYLVKPLDLEELKVVLGRFTEIWKLKREAREFQSSQKDRYSFGSIIRKSEKMEAVCRLAQKISASGSATVLIQGETGTGKGLMASAIHYNSPRKDRPFIKINCATLVEGLLESELFGHEKGAFTGAIKRKPGKFELADKGTIFLDEIGEMSLNLQAKLLRVLEEKEFERVGGTDVIKVDVRLIAATNRDLVQMVKEGTFREDLFYRLNVFPIHIPPLRERIEDTSLMSIHFLQEYSREFGKKVRGFSHETLQFITNHEWKGNVRELKNFVERAVLLSDGELVHVEPRDLGISSTPKAGKAPIPQDFPIMSLEDMETEYIKRVMEMTGGNKSESAHILGITRQRLKRKLID